MQSSPIVSALEATWTAIRKLHPEVPEVVITFGAGSSATRPGAVRLGHWAPARWRTAKAKPPTRKITDDSEVWSCQRCGHVSLTGPQADHFPIGAVRCPAGADEYKLVRFGDLPSAERSHALRLLDPCGEPVPGHEGRFCTRHAGHKGACCGSRPPQGRERKDREVFWFRGSTELTETRPTADQVQAWEASRPPELLPEVFVAGEGLELGAEDVLDTLLHEAAHGLAFVRKIKDTSRQGRYHNARYKELAEELGLNCAKHPSLGWQNTTLAEGTAFVYSDELEQLRAAIVGWRRAEGAPLVAGAAGQGNDDSEDTEDDDSEPTKPRGRVKVVCGCAQPRAAYLSIGVLELGGLTCKLCGEDFTPADPKVQAYLDGQAEELEEAEQLRQALGRVARHTTGGDGPSMQECRRMVRAERAAEAKRPRPLDQRVALVSCGKAKASEPRPAAELYTGGLFRAARRDVERRELRWWVVSAAHALVSPDQVLEPYELKLRRGHARGWAERVARDLVVAMRGAGAPLDPYALRGLVVELHAGAVYADALRAVLGRLGARVELPVAGAIGERLSAYKARRQAA